MKRFIFREARILALKKQEVSLAEVRVAKAAERVEVARRRVLADQAAIDELSSDLLGSEINGLTIIDQIALGMRSRLETSRSRLTESEQDLTQAANDLRRVRISMESLATLETIRREEYEKQAKKHWQLELDEHSARTWLTEGDHD